MIREERFKILFKISKTAIIALLCFYPINNEVRASYTPTEGRISYLVGVMINTNFQETLFNNRDNDSKLGRSQSFALLLQALGDLNSKGSLMAEVTFGTHKFFKETDLYRDEFKLEGIAFDLGYRKHTGGDVFVSAAIGSLYPWRAEQIVNSQPSKHVESEFTSIYSFILGIQYESEINKHPVSYDFKIRKYMSGQLDDQMAIGLSLGWRFGIENK